MVLEAPERHEDEGERMDRMGQEGGREELVKCNSRGSVCGGGGNMFQAFPIHQLNIHCD